MAVLTGDDWLRRLFGGHGPRCYSLVIGSAASPHADARGRSSVQRGAPPPNRASFQSGRPSGRRCGYSTGFSLLASAL